MPYNFRKLKPGYLSLKWLIFFLSLNGFVWAQPSSVPANVVDQVIAVVGNEVVLLSDLEAQTQQMMAQTNLRGDELRCRVIDQLLLNKLLLHHAGVDSVTVSEDQVEQKISQNMAYYIQQVGSVEKLEQYYGKTLAELKDEFKPIIRDQLLIQQMQSKLTSSITASPADVKHFFDAIPEDSLPLINAEMEYAQILLKVPFSSDSKRAAREQLDALRQRIVSGEDFSTLAILYSQDIESAKQGGELGFVNRGDLVPEFEAAAFKLNNTTDVSPIVESPFGFHIIQLIERRGERINCRHILIRAQVQPEDVTKTQSKADSIAGVIRSGSMNFEDAALQYSDDKDTKNNGGLVMNPATGSTRFESEVMEPLILFQLDKLQVGEITNPIYATTREGDQIYRIIKLKSRTLPHRLNIRDDYQRLQELAQADKQNRTLEQWRNKKKGITYIRITDEIRTCENLKDWLPKTP
jgi:peptidyl-prolyl cis-trans isomerase SurA